MKPSNLLLRLLAYLLPGVAGPDDIDPPNSEDPPPDDPDDAADPDDDIQALADDDEEPPPQPRGPSRREREIIELRERAQRAERERDELRNQPRGTTTPALSPSQRQFEEEEALLKNPETNEWVRWKIGVDRSNRQNAEQSQAALARAADDRDAAAYDRAAARNPVYDKYRDKVEEIVKAERMKGNLVQRELVLKFVIGDAAMSGSLKSTKTATTKTTVPRGQSTNARSDVPRKGGTTEQDKRRARLENQII